MPELYYISGLKGKHPLSVATAYMYRGHDIYGPRGNPVDLGSFTSSGKIKISGIDSKLVPKYDPYDPTLRNEEEIGHLKNAIALGDPFTQDVSGARKPEDSGGIDLTTVTSEGTADTTPFACQIAHMNTATGGIAPGLWDRFTNSSLSGKCLSKLRSTGKLTVQ